ncbi:MAG: penicillin-binding protein 2 [Phycisphaerales bacterium]|nr:penicillin-binding protein 2 [Phycisphaerales bacterium]
MTPLGWEGAGVALAIDEVRDARRKRADVVFRVVVFATILLMGAIFVRVVQLQLAPGDRLSGFVQDRASRRVYEGARGDLLDRRGRVLASTRGGFRLFVDPSEMEEPFGPTLEKLAIVAEMDFQEVADRVMAKVAQSRQRVEAGLKPIRYLSVGDVLSDSRVEEARQLGIKGVHLERRSVREQADGVAVASLLGKVGIDHNGLLGAERAYDAMLEADDGHMDFVRDARGRPMWVEAGAYAAPERGDDVRLSIDLVIQQIAYEELERGILECDAAGGRAIVMDPVSGEILAMVDRVRDVPGLVELTKETAPPPNMPSEHGYRFRTIRMPKVEGVDASMMRNRCVEDGYEPGSTFKAFLWAAVTEKGLAKPNEKVDGHKGIWHTEYGRLVKDVTPKDEMTWTEVLVYSSNIGMSQVTRRMTDAQLIETVHKFGFGERVGLPLPGESAGMVTSAKNFTKYTQTSWSFGYEILVTPVQMVRAFSAFARDGALAGTMVTPTLRARSDNDGEFALRYRVIQDWVAYLTRDAMSRVAQAMLDRYVNRGREKDAPYPFAIFGKSGTAEIPRTDGKGYFDGQYNSSFIAGAPLERPRVVVLVVIDDPGPERVRKRTHYGSATAGPVVARIIERTLGYMGVTPTPMPEALVNGNHGERLGE